LSGIIELMERRFRALGLQVAVGDRFIEVDGVGTGGDLLRGELQLNGAKAGWCLGQCGACTVMVDGEAIFSCLRRWWPCSAGVSPQSKGSAPNGIQVHCNAPYRGAGGAVRQLHRRHDHARASAARANVGYGWVTRWMLQTAIIGSLVARRGFSFVEIPPGLTPACPRG
jgi:hypothetical protein